MTICPHCGKELKLEQNHAYANIEAYGRSNSVLTTCCNNFVRISGRVTYTWEYSIDYAPYEHKGIQSDDWGNEKVIVK